MKSRLVVPLLGLTILLVSCSPADVPTETSNADGLVSAPTATTEPSAIFPTETPRNTESVIEGTDEIEAAVKPMETQIPEPTPIPCAGTLTSPNQEGPFYSPGSPERSTLIEEGMPGIPVLLFGRVFDQDCNPIPDAKLDFWLADVNGEYDNVGYRLRGHVFSDAGGNYVLETIEPTAYTGRPPHIHVKVFSPDGEELLITQMYFSGSESSADVSAAPDLLATYLEPDETGRQRVIFNFVVQD